MEFCGKEINSSNRSYFDAIQAIGDSGLELEVGPFIAWLLSSTYQPPKDDLYFIVTTKRAFIYRTSFWGGKIKPESKLTLMRDDIAQINISELSYRHQTGAVWNDYAMFTFIFVMKDGKRFERYLNLGKNEYEINQKLPGVIKSIEILMKVYPVEFGKSRSGAGGYTAGVWLPFPNN
jgi:hypothetical protein